MISIPASVLCADSNSLKPVVMAILLFILRWSCSTMLFRYLTRRIFILFEVKFLLFQVLIPAVLATLLSILIILGSPLFPIALFKNFWAEPFILRLVNKKSTVLPCLSTAQYKYLSLPATLIYVSSSLQLSITRLLRVFMFCSISLENLNTHLWIVEWSTLIPLIAINFSISRQLRLNLNLKYTACCIMIWG